MAKIITLRFSGEALELKTPEGWESVGSEIRPSGSIGFWSWDLESQTLTRKSGSGRPAYRYTIQDQGLYKAGPEYAHRMKPAREERDPFKRVLRELEIPVSLLHRLEGVAEITSRWEDNGNGSEDGNVFKTDGDFKRIPSAEYKSLHFYEVEPGSFLIQYKTKDPGWSFKEINRLESIGIWPGCDPTQLREILQDLIN